MTLSLQDLKKKLSQQLVSTESESAPVADVGIRPSRSSASGHSPSRKGGGAGAYLRRHCRNCAFMKSFEMPTPPRDAKQSLAMTVVTSRGEESSVPVEEVSGMVLACKNGYWKREGNVSLPDQLSANSGFFSECARMCLDWKPKAVV